MPDKKCTRLAVAILVAIVIVIIVLVASRSGSRLSEGFRSLIPDNPVPYKFPSSCAPFNPNTIAHEEEDPLLYRCQHQCATLGPVTERPGESCVQQCVWGWKDPPYGENDGTIGYGLGDPWPRRPPQVHGTDAQWPLGVNSGNVWTGNEFAPPNWQQCFRLCGMDMVCRDSCLQTVSGSWVNKGVLATPWTSPPVRMTTTSLARCRSKGLGDGGCSGCGACGQ